MNTDSSHLIIPTYLSCDTEVEIDHHFMDSFTEIKELQNGKFGRVFLAFNNDNGSAVVIKALQKKDKLRHSIPEIENLQRETRFLRTLNNPFIVGFEFCFETSSCISLGIEYCSKGDIFSYLETDGRFHEDSARFYISQLVLAVEYIHQEGIIHRDIKPENLLLDFEGNLKLCDFGLAKKGEFTSTSGALTNCGTMTYMPPEMFRKSGYGYCVDWWLVGMTAFEILVGQPAHCIIDNRNISNDHHQAILNINFLDNEALSFLTGILESDPKQRLGKKGAEEVKLDAYFDGLNWQDLLEKNFLPPISPHHGFEN